MVNLATETFPGYWAKFGEQAVLITGIKAGNLAASLPDVFGPPVILYYGFVIFNETKIVFPVQAIDDRGGRYDSLKAFDWIWRRGQLFPRSDLIGLQSDGHPVELMLRDLDLAIPPQVYASQTKVALLEGWQTSQRKFVDFEGTRVAAAFQLEDNLHAALVPGGDFPRRITEILPTFLLHADTGGERALELIRQALAAQDPALRILF